MAQPQAHLLGSVNLPDARAVLEAICDNAGDVVGRLPDGETDARSNWIVGQVRVLDTTLGLERVPDAELEDYRPEDARVIFRIADPNVLGFPRLGYADAAIASFSIFSELKREGRIADTARFQVSLPTPIAVVGAFVTLKHQEAVEPFYEAAMAREVQLITDAIPHHELAMQWDVSAEMGNIEGVFPVYFSPILPGVIERFARICAWIPEDVEAGFHLCYGDAGGTHWKEPADTARLVEVANATVTQVDRPLAWIHMPVPIARDDDAYFEPLEDLRFPEETKLFLGLLHKEDGLDGARRRIATAQRHAPHFGVATECGMARDAQPKDVPPLLRLHRDAANLL